VWFLVLRPWTMRITSVLVRLVSISIVWSEIVHNWTHPPLSLVAIVVRATGETWFLMEVLPIDPCHYVELMTELVDVHFIVHGVRDVFKFYET
jgi:hypothetical protein